MTTEPLTIKSLLTEGCYIIPIYQRNYDWGEREVLQLIEDIADYAALKNDSNYHLGSIVVYARQEGGKTYYETVDGQQRLMTLTIIANVLKSLNETQDSMKWYVGSNVEFEHRASDNETIKMMALGKLNEYDETTHIKEVYRLVEKNIKSIKKLGLKEFTKYFLDKVIILRIPVPSDTNLNHYFEIMNSRGEQLEKHEVLKSKLMDKIRTDGEAAMKLFNEIWEACSDMSKYVQMNMRPELRRIIFTESWADLQNKEFDGFVNEYSGILGQYNDSSNEIAGNDAPQSITDLIKQAKQNKSYPLPNEDRDDGNEGSDSFGSVVNFSNFLLHALKVSYHNKQNKDEVIDSAIKLDDKRLIEFFDDVVEPYQDDDHKRAFVKEFIVDLLKIRHLFDNYVIKRVYSADRWSLKKLKKNSSSGTYYVDSFGDENEAEDTSRDILMLESMFHVSAPTQIYKYWLNAVLNFLFQKYDSIKKGELRDMLYQLARAYMLDRYLCDQNIDFEDIIYNNNCQAQNTVIKWDKINQGCGVENFVFNFYDYIIWKENPNNYRRFEFTYRSSVEHFYPQKPMAGYLPLEDQYLNSFGNLCLISNSMNSKFSNNMPKAKVANFSGDKEIEKLSLKLSEMMDTAREGDWGEYQINECAKLAIDRMTRYLNSTT